jgi:hypothetical protein
MTDAFSDAKNVGSTDPQQKGKRTAFPESTNYRMSGNYNNLLANTA